MAYPAWADKPYGFANFLRAARFVNSLYNGGLISKAAERAGGVARVTYKVRLSPKTERGMYDLDRHKRTGATRARKTGFVVPSQDEWIKAAYYDPSGGGTDSYWKYPTNAGVFGDGTATAPAADDAEPDDRRRHQRRDAAGGDLPRQGPAGPDLVPGAIQPQSDCSSVNPFGLDATTTPRPTRAASARSARPRPPRPGARWTRAATRSSGPTRSLRRRPARAAAACGAVCTAAFPTPPATRCGSRRSASSPQDNRFFKLTYPWLGFRIGVVGTLVKKAARRG